MESTEEPQGITAPADVVVLRCEDYDLDRVQDRVSHGLSLLGGAHRFVQPGERILLKPNLLVGKTPEKAVTTHPAVFEAVARLFSYAGATLSYGDSPGFGRISTVVRRSGLAAVADTLGVPLAEFHTGRAVSFPEGRLCKQFTIAEGVFEADGMVSLPKLKTHALTRMTGAVKNQFGCVPGMLKGEFHGRLHKAERFAAMLVDLTRFLAPRLYVMDGILAMEGNGPSNGKPRMLGTLLLSTDPVALDAVACRLINLDPEHVPTVPVGQQLGLGTYTQVRLLGDAIEDLICADFDVNRKPDLPPDMMHRLLVPIMRRHVIPRPVIRKDRCTRCGTCVKMCPVSPKAVDFRQPGHNTPPQYEYGLCIRCYCCQETCPDSAIEVETPWLGRLIHK